MAYVTGLVMWHHEQQIRASPGASLQRTGPSAPLAAELGPDTAPLPCTEALGLPGDLITRLGSSTCSAHK